MLKRSKRGYAIAEFPAAIMLLLLGIFVPMMILGSVFYRVYMFDGAIKGGVQVGAVQSDYTAATTATTNFIANHQVVGMKINAPTMSMIKKPVTYTDATGSHTYQAYFLQAVATGSVNPIVPMASFFGTSVPGLTKPMPLSMTHALYFENQTAAATAAAAS